MSHQKSATACATLLAVTSLLTAGMVWAATDTAAAPATKTAPTKEQREQMAQAHEKMASCLRSDKGVGDCRTEMMQTCRTVNYQGCGMMMGSGMHHKGTQASPSSK